MTKLTFDDANAVTRFDTREDADGVAEIRLFHKRTVLFRFGVDDIAREDWEAELAEFIKEARTSEECEEFLTTEAGEEGEDEEDENEGGSIVPGKYRVKYGAAQNCGDEIALALTDFVTLPRAKGDTDGGLDRAKLRAVVELNGIGDRLAAWEDRELNGGLLRMNTSNVLRGMNRRGERVEIGNEVWEAREVEKKPRKARKAKEVMAETVTEEPAA